MSSLAAPPSPSPSSTPDAPILSAWHRHCHLRRFRNDAGRELLRATREHRLLRADLGRLLAAKQAGLATSGRNSGFHAWLRSHDIPRATAYHLIARFHAPAPSRKPAPRAALNCPTPESKTVSPLPATPSQTYLELRGRTLSIQLTPFQALMFHKFWIILTRPGAKVFDIAKIFFNAVENFLTEDQRDETAQFTLDHVREFTEANCAAVAPIQAFPGDHGTCGVTDRPVPRPRSFESAT